MQISPHKKKFSEFFLVFPKSTEQFEYFEQKHGPRRLFGSDIIDCKSRSFLNGQKAPCQNTSGQSTC